MFEILPITSLVTNFVLAVLAVNEMSVMGGLAGRASGLGEPRSVIIFCQRVIYNAVYLRMDCVLVRGC